MDSRAARAVRNTDAETDADNEVNVCRLSTPEDTPVKITTDSRAESGHRDKQEQDLQESVTRLLKEQDLQEGVTHLSKEQDPQETVKRLSTERNLQETVAHLSQTFQWEELSLLLKNTSPLIARRLVSAIVEPVHRHSPLTACLSVIASVTNDVTTMHDDPGGSATCSDICDTCQVLLSYGADVNHQDWRGRTAVHWAAMAGRVDLLIVLLSFAADVTLADNSGQVALHYAVSSGNQACVDLLLQHDTRVVNVVAGHGLSPLILAVQQGHDTICRQLLEAGAEVTAQEAMTRRTPLHYALYLKRLDLFNLLLNYSPDLTAADHRGTSVVHRCCAVSDVQYLSQLLSACDRQRVLQVINMADSEGATPVTIACQNGHLTHLSALLAHGASVSDRDAHGRTALHHCVENPDTACAELLLKADPSLLAAPDDEGLTPLHLAVIAANVPLIRLLLKRGASLTCRDHQQHTVAHWATVCGHAGVLDVLLEYDVELSSPDAHQAYPVHYAAQVGRPAHADDDELRHSVSEGSQEVHGNLRLLRKLLDHGVSPEVRDKDMRTPIIWAASAGNAEACGLLVAAGANPDAADKDGLCALHCAASRGHVVCVRQLVTTCGARVDPTDQNQCTPLFYAITLGHCDCVTTLLQLGARSAHTDNRGRNSAHCAAVKGSRDILESLRVQGVDLWRPSLKGDYPVHEAAQAGHVEIVQYLLDASPAGTDTVDAANKEGRTCLHIAALTNNLRLAKVLLDRGADVNAVMKTKGKSYTSYDAAVAKGYKEAADYLLFRGGTSAAKLKEASSVTECHQEELVDAGQSHGTQQGAHAHAGEMQAPPVTVVVVTSSPAREIGKEILVVGGVQLETGTSEEVDERVHSRHCETPGPSGDMANGLTVTVDDNEVGDKNKSVTADFPQTETGETEIVPSTQTKDGFTPETASLQTTETRDGSTPETASLPTTETRDGSTPETASLPTTETRDGSTPETASLQTTETRDGPTNEARDGPTTDKTNIINSDIRDTTPAASDALTFQTKDITAAESRDAQIAETRDEPSTDTEDMPAIEAVTGDMPFTGSRDMSVTERRDMPVTQTRDMPVTQTTDMPVTQTRDMTVTHNRDIPVTQTTDMPVTQTTDLPVTQTRDMPVTQTRDLPVTETRDMPVTQTTDMPVTETTDMTVTETRDMPITETTDMTVTETTDMTVTETRDMPITETTDMTVTETRDMTVTHNRDMPVTQTRDMPVTETTDMTVTHNRDMTVTGTRDMPLTETRDMTVTHNRDMPVTETRDMPVTQTRDMTVTETRDMPVTQTRDMPVTQTTDMPVTQTRDMPVTQTRDMPVTQTTDMPVTQTRDMPVTQTTDMPVTQTRDMTVTHNRDMPVTQTTDLPVTQTRDMPVTQTRDMPVTQTRDMPVTQTRDLPVTETRDMPVTQTTDMPVTQTRDMPVTETTDMTVTQTTDMPVTETTDMPVTQTTDMTVTQTTDMTVTQTTDMPVTETTDMPVTEGTLSADREREAAGDEERDSLTSVDSNVTNDLTNKAPCDSHDLDFDQCLKKPETTESQLHDAVSNKMKDTSAPRLQDKLHWEHGTGATQAHDTPDEQTVELASISTGRYEYAKHEKAVDTHSPKEDTTTDSADTATNDTKCSGSDGTAPSDRKCSQSKDTIAKNRHLPSRLPMVTAKEEETTKPSDGKGRKVSQRKARVASGRRPRQTATTDRDMIPTSTATGLHESQGVTKRQQKPWQDEGHKQATTEPRQPDEREDEPRIDHVTGQHLSATCTPFSGASSTGNATNGASKGRKDTRHEGTNENSAQGGTSTGRKRSKEGHDMGDLNNLSDNDNTDANSDLAGNAVNMSPSGGTRETKDVRKVCEDKGLEDTTTGKEPRSRRPRTSHVILEVQASVQRFESERRSIRALQQVRRAHMTNTLAHDLKLFRSLLLVGGSKHHKDTRFKTEGKKSRPSPIPKKLDKRKQLRCNGWNLQRRRSEVEEDIDKDMEENSADLCPDPSMTPASPKHRGDTRVRPPSRIENHSETSKELSPRLLLREWQQEHHMKVQRSLVLAYSHHVSHQALPAIYHSGKQRSSYQSSQTNTSRPSRPSTTKSLWVSRSHSDSPMSTTRTDNLTSGTVSMTNKGLTSGPNGVSRAQLSFIRRASSLVTSYGASHLYLDPITTQSCEHS